MNTEPTTSTKTITMKLAKANDNDIRVAAITTGMLSDVFESSSFSNPDFPRRADGEYHHDDPEYFDEENPEHIRMFYDRLKELLDKREHCGALRRVVWGFDTLLNKSNQIVDPDEDTLAFHPRLQRAKALLESLEPIGQRLHTQDNACTQNPMYCVQQKVRVYGVDENYQDGSYWSDSHGDLIDEDDEDFNEETCVLEGYKDIWCTVMACFSADGAQAYLDNNAHNLRSPRIYVESWHRCDEMLAIRNALMSATPQAQPLAQRS